MMGFKLYFLLSDSWSKSNHQGGQCETDIVGDDSLTTQSESVASKVWDKMTAAEERTRLLEGLLRQGVGTADIETRYLPKGKQGKGS